MHRFAFRMAVGYVCLGTLYLLLADIIIRELSPGTTSSSDFLTWEVVKGLAFVGLTGVGIYYYGKRSFARIHSSEVELDRRDDEISRLKETFEMVSHSINDGFFLLDTNLHFTYANPAYLALIGKHLDEVVGKPWNEMSHKTKDMHEQLIDAAKHQQYSTIESFDDVLNEWYRVIVFPHQVGVVVLLRNITESKVQDIMFKQEHENLLALINNTSDYILAIDSDHNLIVANTPFLDRVEALTGTKLKFGERNTYGFLSEEYSDTWQVWVERALSGESLTVEWEIVHKAVGEIVHAVTMEPIRREGVVEGATIRIHNITEFRNTQAELRRQVSRFDLISRATNDAIWEWILEPGVLQWNSGLNALFGYDLRETPIEWWKERIHDDDKEEILAGFDKWMTEGIGSWTAEYRFLAADGSYRWVLDRGFAVDSQGEKSARFFGAMQDVTQEREYRAHMEYQNTGLREIAFMSSHELRGPLASLMGLLHLIDRENPDNPQNVQLVSMLDEAAASMDAVIHRLVQKSYEIEKSSDRMAR